jgi:transcriptional regulator with XRE-family HTH domain
MMPTSLGRKLRVLRAECGLTLREAASRADVAKETISDTERGLRHPHDVTVAKLARAYDVPVEDLLEEPVLAGEREDGPSLEELTRAAALKTRWLTMPEEEWRASWPLSQTPQDAMKIVQEMALELGALKPLMAGQERGLPIYKRAASGRYKQAWLRWFQGMQAAHKCGVANGLITQEESLNDLEKKLELGERPGVRYEGMQYAS